MLEEGRCASTSEVAAAEKLDRGCLGRILQLRLLAPNIVQEIPDGRRPEESTLPRLTECFPIVREEQRPALDGEAALQPVSPHASDSGSAPIL